MALDFAVTTPNSLVAAGVPSTVTITLIGTGSLASTATFTGTGAGTAGSAPTLLTGAVAGASTTFQWTTGTTSVLTVTASGGLVAAHTLLFTVPKPNTVSSQMLIDQALGLLGVKAPGEPTNAGEAMSCLLRLNMVLDMWRTEALYAYASQPITGVLKAGAKSLTIGPSGDIVTPYRPISIDGGSFFTSGLIDYGITPITESQYNAIPLKGVTVLGPGGFYYSPDLPNGTLYFYPQASADVAISLSAMMELQEFADLTTTYVLPPGYRMALAYTLAEMMAPDYSRPIPPVVSQMAVNARRAIRKANSVTPVTAPARKRGTIYVGWEN